MARLNEIINSIFFETLEYIVAPMMLILLTHLLLSGNDKIKGFRHYALEYNFVSLYSNLLFYFSLSAHPNIDPHRTATCLCAEVNSALLINCVFVFFFVMVHKQFENENSLPKILRFVFFNAWKVVMLILFILIITINVHAHGYTLSYHFDDIWETCKAFILFLGVPDHLLLAIFMIIIISMLIIALLNDQYAESTLAFQGPSSVKANLPFSERIKKQIEIAKNKKSKPEVRAQSYYYAAEYSFEKGDVKNAVHYINDSKKIALDIPYPETLLLPIRKLKMKISLALNKAPEADSEIAEVLNKLPGTVGIAKTILEYCIKELEAVLPQHNHTTQPAQ